MPCATLHDRGADQSIYCASKPIRQLRTRRFRANRGKQGIHNSCRLVLSVRNAIVIVSGSVTLTLPFPVCSVCDRAAPSKRGKPRRKKGLALGSAALTRLDRSNERSILRHPTDHLWSRCCSSVLKKRWQSIRANVTLCLGHDALNEYIYLRAAHAARSPRRSVLRLLSSSCSKRTWINSPRDDGGGACAKGMICSTVYRFHRPGITRTERDRTRCARDD